MNVIQRNAAQDTIAARASPRFHPYLALRYSHRVTRVVLLSLLLLLLAACEGDGSADGDTPTPAPTIAATPPAGPGSIAPPLDVPIQTAASCPIDDETLCALALDLRNAVATGGMDAIASRLMLRERPCAGIQWFVDREVGCTSSAGTTVPVAPIFNYGSDCCYADREFFLQMFELRLGLTVDDTWRIWGFVQGSPFWEGARAVLLIRGAPEDRQVVEIGTSDASAAPGITGAIFGTVSTLYINPGATLVTWKRAP